MTNPRVICTTPRSGSTAVARFMACAPSVDAYSEFCNPRYMTGLHGTEWGARREEYFRNPKMGLKIMFEHMKQDYIPYLQKNGAIFLVRLNKFAQAVSFYFATSTGRWYQNDAYQKAPAYDYDLIEMHLNRIFWHEDRWLELLYENEVDFKVEAFETMSKENYYPGERDRVHLDKKLIYEYRFAKAFSARNSMNWAHKFRGEWKGEIE